MRTYNVLVKTEVYTWVELAAEDQEEADRLALEKADAFDDLSHFRHAPWWIERGYRCLDCGVDTCDIGEYPIMLRDDVWLSIVPDGRGMLCRADMERRLGRPLTCADYRV